MQYLYFHALIVMENESVFFIAHQAILTFVCAIITALNASLTDQHSDDTALTKEAGAKTREAIR